ncbi:MAG: hypothetical protein HYT94_03315 [Parcubacteria group bacterium]|nr:hypothetical protein [Parcubacteria group bacterium]
MVKSTPVFICGKNPSDSLHAENKLVFGTELSCYVTYYRSLTAFLGAPVALLDLKRRVVNDKYANEECHQIAHAIGRSAVENNLVVATAFAAGDPLCADGYFHGVMEGIIQKRGTKEISVEFLNGLCEPFRQNQSSGADHYNCAHGIGHGSHACPV